MAISTPYTKPATTTEKQIEILQKRGLIINDFDEAKYYLSHVGFYRLAGYWLNFQNDIGKHTFNPGTTFAQVIETYEFDRKLRVLLLDAIERIEVSLRAVISNQMSIIYTPKWYSQYHLAHNEQEVDNIMKVINEEIERRKHEDFVRHHDRTYGADQYMPAWKVMDILSLGSLSKLYGNIKNTIAEKRIIAKIFGFKDELWLQSYLQVISILRNHCAHHSRICYRKFSNPPKLMKRPILNWINHLPTPGGLESQTIYYQLCAIAYLLQTAFPTSNFVKNLLVLLTKTPGIDLNRMGFYSGWEREDIWNN